MANRFWVGGTGNWSDATNHWATSSGGAPGAGNLPTATDDVFFDTLSNALAYTVTIDATTKLCRDITFAAPTSGNVTWAGSVAMNISGSMTLYAGLVRTYTGALTFNATTTGKTIACNGVSFASVVTFNGVGGGWTLSDDFIMGGGSSSFTLTNGSFVSNGKTMTCALAFNSSNSNVRSIDFGASTLNFTNGVTLTTTTNLTFNAGTSTINITNGSTTFNGGGLTFYNVIIGASNPTINGANTFNNLTLSSIANKVQPVTLSANQITGTFTANGNSVVNRILVQSSVKGTARTITAATVSASNIDFQDIVGAGAGSWNLSATSSGDCGGNSGITFTTPATQYAKTGVSANWSGAIWFTTSGGATPGRVPLPQDTAIFDANSITAGSVVITQDMPRIPTVDWTGVTNTPTWTTSTVASVFGSITLVSGMTLTASTQAYTFEGRGSFTLTSAGKTWAKQFIFSMPGGTLTLLDDFVDSNTAGHLHNNGHLDLNNFNVQSGGLNSNSGFTRTLSLGSGTWTLIGTGTSWLSTSTGLTLNQGTSTIKITDTTGAGFTFSGGGLTYNNIWFSRGTSNGTNTISGSNTFNDFKDDTSAARTISFTAGTVNVANTWTINGNVGNILTLQSSSAGTRFYLIDVSGSNTYDYLSLRDSNVGGGATWTAGVNSTFVSNNEGWSDQPTTPRRYWITGGTGNWNSTTNWSATSGGASGASLPTGDMDVFFDASSGAGTSTVNANSIMRNLDFTGFTGTLAGSSALSIYGSITLASTMTNSYTGAIGLKNSLLSRTIACGTKSFGGTINVGDSISTNSVYLVDIFTLSDNFNSTSTVTLNSGTLNLNNFDASSTTFTSSNSNFRALIMGSGTYSLTSTAAGTIWNCGTVTTNFTVTPNTSTIKLTGSTTNTRTFAGGGLTYNNLWFSNATGAGRMNLIGSNTFNDLKCDTPPQTIGFTAGTTTTVNTFTVNGTAGNLITIASITAAGHNLVKSGGGTISSDYLSISRSTATPSTTWYAGANSTDGGNNSGWIFTAPPAGNNSGMFFAFASS